MRLLCYLLIFLKISSLQANLTFDIDSKILLQNISIANKNFLTFAADTIMTVSCHPGTPFTIGTGKIILKKPNLAYIEAKGMINGLKGKKFTTISDGKILWQIFPDNNQSSNITVHPQGHNISGNYTYLLGSNLEKNISSILLDISIISFFDPNFLDRLKLNFKDFYTDFSYLGTEYFQDQNCKVLKLDISKEANILKRGWLNTKTYYLHIGSNNLINCITTTCRLEGWWTFQIGLKNIKIDEYLSDDQFLFSFKD